MVIYATLESTFNLPPGKPRQFYAVFIKNFTLLSHQYVGMIAIFLVVGALVGLLGYLHIYYESVYAPSDPIDNSPPMNITLMSNNSMGNYAMYLSYYQEDGSFYDFGRCTSDQKKCTGFLAGFENEWVGTDQQIRIGHAPPADLDPSQTYLPLYYYPYFKQATADSAYSTKQFEDYQNETTYKLMEQWIEAEKYPPKPENPPDNWYNMMNYLEYDRMMELYATGVYFSYLSTSGYGGMNYTLHGYSSHQNPVTLKQTNYEHYCVTYHMLFYNYLRFVFKQGADKQPPMIFGYQRQLWDTPEDSGADASTPIFQCFVLPLCFLLLIPYFTYYISQEKGDGLLSLYQMMGLRFYPRFYADFCYYLIVSILLLAVIIAVYAGCGMEIIERSSSIAWVFCFILFTLNVPVISQLIAAFTDSGRVSSIIAIIVIFIYAFCGVMICSYSYNQADDMFSTLEPWYSFLPGFGPIYYLIYISYLLVSYKADNFLTNADITLSLAPNPSNTQLVGYYTAISFLISYLMLIVYYALSIYIDKITPRRNGIPEHPLFFCYGIYTRACVHKNVVPGEITFKKAFWAIGYAIAHPSIIIMSYKEVDVFIVKNKRSDGVEADSSDNDSSTGSTTFDYLRGKSDTAANDISTSDSLSQIRKTQKRVQKQLRLGYDDPDLLSERRLVEGNVASNGTRALVRLLNLRKTYPATRYTPAKHAVRGVSYVVGEGECLCLLGANGCGKTTQINMLSMLFKPTSGNAYICDYSISDARSTNKIQQNLGICPQFDILYPTLTVRQHLDFYARIKGTSTKYMKYHVEDLLAAVELTLDANKVARALSGGMYRRLSIAIALCNKPKVLIFDEPSSGLDVQTRRALWNVILKARTGRAILLTTHAMEEAETLATRIAIMADGRIRTIGAYQSLKAKFGSGYYLKVCVNRDLLQPGKVNIFVGSVELVSELEYHVHKSILEISHDLLLVSCYYGQLVYYVPENMQISEIFSKMQGLMLQETGICDWGLSYTSLENVFMKVVENCY